MWFIDVEVEQETSAPPPNKNRGSAPASSSIFRLCVLCPHLEKMMLLIGRLKLVRCSLLVVIWLVAKPKLLLQKKKKISGPWGRGWAVKSRNMYRCCYKK